MSDELHTEVREPGPRPKLARAGDGRDRDGGRGCGLRLARRSPRSPRRKPSGTSTSPTCSALAADFDNYRKRALRDQQAFASRAAERLVAKLLPVLDDLERALEAAEHHEEAQVLEGVEMTRSALAAALASEGCEEIDADGAFDPHVHEALLAQPVEGVEPGSIVQVVQRGYRLGDAVLRPARVIVAE